MEEEPMEEELLEEELILLQSVLTPEFLALAKQIVTLVHVLKVDVIHNVTSVITQMESEEVMEMGL